MWEEESHNVRGEETACMVRGCLIDKSRHVEGNDQTFVTMMTCGDFENEWQELVFDSPAFT